MRPNIVIRTEATQNTINSFFAMPMVLGYVDCAKMVSNHLSSMGYPEIFNELNAFSYDDERGALKTLVKFLKANNCATIEDYLDSKFERIPSAQCLLGDIGLMVTEHETLPAFCVIISGARYLGFAQLAEGGYCSHAGDHTFIKSAWRITPKEVTE